MKIGRWVVDDGLLEAYWLYAMLGKSGYLESKRTALHNDVLRSVGFDPYSVRYERPAEYVEFEGALRKYFDDRYRREHLL